MFAIACHFDPSILVECTAYGFDGTAVVGSARIESRAILDLHSAVWHFCCAIFTSVLRQSPVLSNRPEFRRPPQSCGKLFSWPKKQRFP